MLRRQKIDFCRLFCAAHRQTGSPISNKDTKIFRMCVAHMTLFENRNLKKPRILARKSIKSDSFDILRKFFVLILLSQISVFQRVRRLFDGFLRYNGVKANENAKSFTQNVLFTIFIRKSRYCDVFFLPTPLRRKVFNAIQELFLNAGRDFNNPGGFIASRGDVLDFRFFKSARKPLADERKKKSRSFAF